MKKTTWIIGIVFVAMIGIGLSHNYILESEQSNLLDAWVFNDVILTQTLPEVNTSLNLTLYGKSYVTTMHDATYISSNGSWNVPVPVSLYDNNFTSGNSGVAPGYSAVHNATFLIENMTAPYAVFYANNVGTTRTNQSVVIPTECISSTMINLTFYSLAAPGAQRNAIFCWNTDGSGTTEIYNSGISAGSEAIYEYSLESPNITAHYPLDGDTNDKAYWYNLTDNDVAFIDGLGKQYGYFNGSAYANYSVLPSIGNAGTISAWVMGEQQTSQYPMIAALDDVMLLFYNNDSQQMGCYSYNNTGTVTWSPLSINLVNNLTHAACVYNGTHVLMYVNGLLQKSYFNGLLNQTAARFDIGYQPGHYWKGAIDDVRVYSSALSATEIKQLYEVTRPPLLQGGDVFNFSGINSHMNTTADIILNETDAISIETMVTVLSTDAWRMIAEHSPYWLDYNDAWDLIIGANQLWVSINGDVGERHKYISFSPGTYHIVATIDKGASPDEIKIYVNGQEETGTYLYSSDNTNNFGSYPLYVGLRGLDLSYPFNGTIDYIKIYDRKLSAWEAEQHYLAAIAGSDDGAINFINVSIYDEETGALITEQMYGQIMNNVTEQSHNTTTGNFLAYNIPASNSTVRVWGENYSARSINVEVYNGSEHQLGIYLSTTLEEVVFTIKDTNSKRIITNALVTMQRLVGEEWQTVESKLSDVTGKAQFKYTPDKQYKFVVIATGYVNKEFVLDPVLYSSYDVLMTPTPTTATRRQFYGVAMYYSPKLFYNGQLNNHTFFIASPGGELTGYGFNATYPNTDPTNRTYSVSGSNSLGGTLSISFPINGSGISSTVNVTTWYQTNSDYVSMTESFYVIGADVNGTFIQLQSEEYGFNVLEKMLIAMFSVIVASGLAFFVAGSAGAFLAGLGVYGYFAYLSFVPVWSFIITLIVGLVIMLRGSR